MLDALRRLWRGSDLPRSADGRLLKPLAVRDGGRGTEGPPTVSTRALQRAEGARNMDWGSRAEAAVGTAAMSSERFHAMGHYEQLRWDHATRRVEVARPEHHVVLRWWGD